MRISSIYVSNFLGAAAVEIDVRAPVLLACGPNAAGKSSIRDAVALALTADLGRVSLKKDAAQLVRDGADAAVCEVRDADGDPWAVSISRAGKITDSKKGHDPDPVLPYVLDAQRFARLDETARRAFLFGLVGLKVDAGEIARRLEARGGHIGKMQRILPLLRTGFDAAAKQAKTYATEAKGAWRTVTGETYGSEKAKTWRATVPPYDAAAASEIARQLQHADHAIAQWQEQVGKLQGEEQRRAALRAKLPALAEHMAKLQRLQEKLATDTQQLTEWEADLQKTAAAAGAAPRVGLVHDLAKALHAVALDPRMAALLDLETINDVLTRYEHEHGPIDGKAGDARALARLQTVRESRDLCARAVANAKRDVDAALAAKTEHERIAAELAAEFDADGLANARLQVQQLTAERAAVAKRSDEMRTIKALVDSAEAKTKQAGEHAAAVADWDLIGDALSPDGIPAELLAEAIKPINGRLAQSAADAGWQQVVVHDDMRITYGGRAYGLISESERWRCDAMVAEAIAQTSGTRLLVLDRMDVLDLPGRGELLGWLDVLAEAGEIDSALVFATLKQPPQGLGERVQVEWITAGVAGHQPLKAAA